MRGKKKLTRRQRYLLRDCTIGALIGFGIASMPFWDFGGAVNFMVTAISLSLIATYAVIGTNPIWNKKSPRTAATVDGQKKATAQRAPQPSFYTIGRDTTI